MFLYQKRSKCVPTVAHQNGGKTTPFFVKISKNLGGGGLKRFTRRKILPVVPLETHGNNTKHRS